MIRSTCLVADTVASTIGGRSGSRRCRHHHRSSSSSSSSTSNTMMVDVERISARIFCPFPDPTPAAVVMQSDSVSSANNNTLRGGNPVTIFKVQSTRASLFSEELRSQLASSCAWESVFVFPPDISADTAHDVNDNHSTLPQLNMAFYLPTGQPVTFCAHAAMGAAYAYFQNANDAVPKVLLKNFVNNDGNDGTATKSVTPAVAADHDPSPTYVATFQQEESDSDHQKSGTIALEVQNIVWQQEPIEHPTMLHRILREYHKVNGSTDCTLPMIEVLPTQEQWQEQNLDQYEPQMLKSKYNKVIPLPTFLNSWVGDRKKTLVYINKDDTLHERILPPPSRAAAVHYPTACDSLQHTTGLYLYATKTTSQDKMADAREIKLDYPVLDPNAEENVWECRQFPRQSGYPEDPATGVAAAALAISLRFCEIETQRILGTGDTTTTTATTTDLLSTAPSSKYEFYQGTAMQQPSYIVVENIQIHSLVTQSDESNIPPVASDELSIFKYAKPADNDNGNANPNQDNNSIPASSIMADKMNQMAETDLLNDDERLAQEAARVDLFHDADDDEVSDDDEEEDDDGDDDDPATEDAAVTLPPPPKDFRYQKHRGIASFTLIGRIEVDAVETIQVEVSAK